MLDKKKAPKDTITVPRWLWDSMCEELKRLRAKKVTLIYPLQK